LRHGFATHAPTKRHQLAAWTSRDVQSAIEFDTARFMLNTPGMALAQVAKLAASQLYFWIMERTRPSH
jgi:hypothetical protein